MTKIKVAINGFGRIGRLTARNLIKKFSDKVEIVAINDLTSPKNLAYLFQNDSTYRHFEGDVSYTENSLIINGGEVKVFAQKDPSLLPWGDLNIDVVLECTGRFLSAELASLHIKAGSKKVILSAPAKDESILTIVQGVNVPSIYTSNGEYIHTDALKSANIVSNASCTTNCISPALKVLENEFGIVNSTGVTIHAYTATQMLQDAPSQKDFRDGRAAGQNIIPSKTGAAKATYLVLPELTGKLGLTCLRVPVITGSLVYLNVNLKKGTTVEEINSAFKKYADGEMKNILGYSEDEIVSTDIIQNSNSCIFDSKLTELNGENFAKIVVWYDNEWGYSSRLAESIINLFEVR